jgi:hypothetical protein
MNSNLSNPLTYYIEMDVNTLMKKFAVKGVSGKEMHQHNYNSSYVQMGPNQPILAPHSGTFEIAEVKNQRYSNGSNTGTYNNQGMSFGGKKIT